MTDASSAETGAAADTRASATSQAEFGALLCDVLPRQGCWSDEGYLWLTDHGRRRIEFTDGFIEELPLPSDTHQTILAFLHSLFRAWIRPRGGIAVFSGLRMQVREGKYREPDVVLLLDRCDPRRQDRYWLGADLVAEVVSPDAPERDWVEKRADYAEAAIPRVLDRPIPGTRRSRCWYWKVRRTPSRECMPAAARRRRYCSKGSRPTCPPCSTHPRRALEPTKEDIDDHAGPRGFWLACAAQPRRQHLLSIRPCREELVVGREHSSIDRADTRP